MKLIYVTSTFAALFALSACQQSATYSAPAASTDACGASQYQNLVGGPSSVAGKLTDIPDDSRHYGSEETVATNNPNRLNFVHSGTAIESVTNPDSTVIRVFCG